MCLPVHHDGSLLSVLSVWQPEADIVANTVDGGGIVRWWRMVGQTLLGSELSDCTVPYNAKMQSFLGVRPPTATHAHLVCDAVSS